MKGYPNNIRKVDARRPDPDTIREAALIVNEGGVIAFPTTGLYGLGVDAYHPEALKRLFHLKKRPPSNPILILIKERSVIDSVAESLPPEAIRLMDRFWPGDITIVFKAKANLPESLTGGTGKIGIRMPAHPVAKALVAALDHPITGTSANISGRPGCSDIRYLDSELKKSIDLIIDAGSLTGGKSSTVIDVSESPCRVIREGRIGQREIFSPL